MNAKTITMSFASVSYSIPGTVTLVAKMSFEFSKKKQVRVKNMTKNSYSVAPMNPMTV